MMDRVPLKSNALTTSVMMCEVCQDQRQKQRFYSHNFNISLTPLIVWAGCCCSLSCQLNNITSRPAAANQDRSAAPRIAAPLQPIAVQGFLQKDRPPWVYLLISRARIYVFASPTAPSFSQLVSVASPPPIVFLLFQGPSPGNVPRLPAALPLTSSYSSPIIITPPFGLHRRGQSWNFPVFPSFMSQASSDIRPVPRSGSPSSAAAAPPTLFPAAKRWLCPRSAAVPPTLFGSSCSCPIVDSIRCLNVSPSSPPSDPLPRIFFFFFVIFRGG
ncbi:uncharacterized protein LOC114142705 [Xiphophorus couchianus]|uniref:uncharacterized protein LOC114142705 n=1 Tax=Xiphophorus couchianus TaxID=32473 RepID=UPI00101672A5|nr:uncharacterized protein LOC114142705 [Xiphophorus couchianus]